MNNGDSFQLPALAMNLLPIQFNSQNFHSTYQVLHEIIYTIHYTSNEQIYLIKCITDRKQIGDMAMTTDRKKMQVDSRVIFDATHSDFNSSSMITKRLNQHVEFNSQT